jgi:putative acetyltransferase
VTGQPARRRTTACRLRPETDADAAGVRAVHLAAFPTPLESRLVDALRRAGKAVISLVAETDGRLVGHILFSAVDIDGSRRQGLGLAPVAILPDWQREGIGSALIETGLARARALGYDLVVVLGEPDYYRRFGFATASGMGLRNQYGADAAFMALALKPGGLAGVTGLVRYQPEFSRVTS